MAEEEKTLPAPDPEPLPSAAAEVEKQQPAPPANDETNLADLGGGEAEQTQEQTQEQMHEQMRQAVAEMRIERVLKENAKICGELAEVGRELDKARLTEEELQVTWRGASNAFSRQKLVAENMQKSSHQQSRLELQRLAEAANQMSELRSVHSQLMSVNRQLDFAVNLQSAALTQCENKIAARTRRIRKLELAIYRLISEAQCHSSLERSVANLVSRCGPLVHNVLSREAQRQALELAEREEAARESREGAAAA